MTNIETTKFFYKLNMVLLAVMFLMSIACRIWLAKNELDIFVYQLFTVISIVYAILCSVSYFVFKK